MSRNSDPSYGAKPTIFSDNGHDLIGDGDLTFRESVHGAAHVILAAHSDDANSFSVSVRWEDQNGNLIQEETASELSMSNITDDWSRLVTKAQYIEVTLTDTSGGAQNNVNVTLTGGE